MTEAAYDAIAEWYDSLVRADDAVGELVRVSLFNVLGEVSGQQVCDLACGQGRIAHELAQRGAQVVGVDLSANLIAIAQREASHEAIQYLVDDAETLSTIEDEQFDVVVCNLALMDIPDLPKTVNSVWRILRVNGSFVFSITHPCFEAPHSQWVTASDGKMSREVSTYFQEGFWRSSYSEGVRGKVGAYHRTLSTYINTLTEAGFNIVQVIEPEATTDKAKRVPHFHIVPAFMLMRCRKDEHL